MLNRLYFLCCILLACQYGYAQNKVYYADKVNIRIWIDGVFFENNFIIEENKMTYTRPYTSFEKSKSVLKKLNIVKFRKIVLNNDTAKQYINSARELFLIQKKDIVKKILTEDIAYDVPDIKITYYKKGCIVSETQFLYSYRLAEYDEDFQILFRYLITIIRNEKNEIRNYWEKKHRKNSKPTLGDM